MVSLQLLLITPVPDDPQDAVVSAQMIKHHDLYERTAKYWTAFYACPENSDARKNFPDFEEKLVLLRAVSPKSSNDTLVAALSSHEWDVQKAHDYISP